MTTITRRQKEVLQFVHKHMEQKGYPPSGREIAKGLRINGLLAVQKHLAALERKGFLRKGTGPRALEMKHRAVGRALPIIGQVAAGQPILAEENIEGTLTIDSSIARWENCFLLRVKGDSMKGAAILDKDLVVVKPQEVAENNEIVVALLGDEATVKRFSRQKGDIFLLPENPDFKPIRVTNHENARILGKVVGVVRT